MEQLLELDDVDLDPLLDISNYDFDDSTSESGDEAEQIPADGNVTKAEVTSEDDPIVDDPVVGGTIDNNEAELAGVAEIKPEPMIIDEVGNLTEEMQV